MRAKALLIALVIALLPHWVVSEEVRYKSGEINVFITPGEPSQVRFPGKVAGGFKKKLSSLSIERKDSDLIVFASEGLPESGEAIIVRLEDGRSYSLRINRSSDENPRSDFVEVKDERGSLIAEADEEAEPAYKEKNLKYAPPTQVSGLMREMVLVAEFGKQAVLGYQMSDKHRGEVVLADGTVRAVIDRIFIGPNLWGYVIEAENMVDQTQRLNPASFRIDGTRAISASEWELAPRPLNIEQQIAGKHKIKVYVITRPKRTSS